MIRNTNAKPHWFFCAYEFLIKSEILIPGALPAELTSGMDADIEIVLGRAFLDSAVHREGPYRHAPGHLLFEIPGIAKYLCDDGRRITIEPARSASTEDITDMLIATALPALLWMRGEVVLHAAGIVPNGTDTVVAVCGPSGAGKSTILRNMVARGCRVVGDDTLRLRFEDDAVIASGLPGRYCWDSNNGPQRVGHDLRLEQTLVSARLGAVFILEWPRLRPNTKRFARDSGVEALRHLLAQRHRPRVPQLVGNEGAFLARFASLAQSEIIHWSREEGLTALTEEEVAFLSNFASIV